MTTPTPDDWRTIFAALAVIVSVASFAFSWRSWRQTNRPIVSASVETYSGGNESIAYNLAISNTGNRPAANVRLKADRSTILNATSDWIHNPDTPNTAFDCVIRCFSDEGEIALLINGKTVTNSFGYTTGEAASSFWKYGAAIPVTITYRDLEGSSYTSKQTLRIKDSGGFAGGMWEKARYHRRVCKK